MTALNEFLCILEGSHTMKRNVRKAFNKFLTKKIYLAAIALLAVTATGLFLMTDSSVSAQKGDRASRGENSRGEVARADMLAFALNMRSANDQTVFGQKGVRGDAAAVSGKVSSGSDANLAGGLSGAKVRSDLTKSFSAINQLPCVEMEGELTGGKFTPGVYCAPSAALSGNLTLDGEGIYVFRVDGKMKTADGFGMTLENGAKGGSVYFIAGETASIAAYNTVEGTFIARNTVNVGDGATVKGRVLSVDSEVILGASSNLVVQTGVIEICKEAFLPTDVATPATLNTLGNRIFQFLVNGVIYQAPVGGCTGPITIVDNTPTTIEELNTGTYLDRSDTWNNRFRLVSVTATGSGSIVPGTTNLPARTVQVTVPDSTIANQTVVTFTNTIAIPAVIEICKRAVAGDPDVTGFFDFTVDAIPNQIFTVPVGQCSGAIQVLPVADSGDPVTVYSNGFETDIDGWFTPTRVASGSNGITSATGSWHAEATTDFTRWGGYSSTFPVGGYTTSVDIYLDMACPANDTRFDFSSAINTPAGGHRRDFVFNGGCYTDSDATGTGPRFVFSAGTTAGRANSFPKNPAADPIAVAVTGWYTFQHRFYDSGSGVLAVDLTILDSNGVVVNTWTLSDPTDIIGVTVGGNRYGWFVNNEFAFLAIDNSSLTLPGTVPNQSLIRVTEIAETGFTLESASTFPADRFVALSLNQGISNSIACSTIGEGPTPPGCVFSNPGGGYVTAEVVEGDTSNQTTINFFNRTNPGVVKICKIAGPGIPEGTRFRFEVRGRAPSNPFPGVILPGSDIIREVVVNAGPAAQGGFCNFVRESNGDLTRFIIGTQVLVTELLPPLDPVNVSNGGEIRVSRIRLNQMLTGFPAAPQTVQGITVNPNPNLVERRAVFIARRETTELEYTNFVFRPTVLKICKIAGPGVDIGTPYTFIISIDTVGGIIPGQTNQPIAVPNLVVEAGPASSGGFCAFAQGPYTPTNTNPPVGTFRVGSVVTVTELAGNVTSITSPTGSPIVDLGNRRAILTLGFPAGFNELVFTNGASLPVQTAFSIAGRVLTPDGGGLRNAQVVLTKTDGTKVSVPTSSMGYYSFDGLANETYTVGVSSRRYRFQSRQIELNSSLADVNFTGIE